MSFERIEREWMRIATPGKVAEPMSAVLHRMRTGAKGIGRLEARRIAATGLRIRDHAGKAARPAAGPL